MAMFTSAVTGSSLMEKAQLTIEDVKCPICLYILIKPVTLPSCKHSFCYECYEKHTENTSLCCPCCRKRLSLRNAIKHDKLLDKDLWNRLKNEFTESIAARENGKDQAEFEGALHGHGQVMCSSRGAIFYEFKKLRREIEKQSAKQRLEEKIANAAVLKKLQDDERERIKMEKKRKRERKRIEKEDFIVAKKLHRELNKVQVEPRQKSVRNKIQTKKYSSDFV